jgi:hypothetical protein
MEWTIKKRCFTIICGFKNHYKIFNQLKEHKAKIEKEQNLSCGSQLQI